MKYIEEVKNFELWKKKLFLKLKIDGYKYYIVWIYLK